MRFKRAGLRYGETPEPVTPYQKAAQVWDERIGSSRVQAHNWRLMALGSLHPINTSVTNFTPGYPRVSRR